MGDNSKSFFQQRRDMVINDLDYQMILIKISLSVMNRNL